VRVRPQQRELVQESANRIISAFRWSTLDQLADEQLALEDGKPNKATAAERSEKRGGGRNGRVKPASRVKSVKRIGVVESSLTILACRVTILACRAARVVRIKNFSLQKCIKIGGWLQHPVQCK
jgi:hypothetical protein